MKQASPVLLPSWYHTVRATEGQRESVVVYCITFVSCAHDVSQDTV